MPARLTAVSAVDEPGGAEIHLLRLVGELVRRGWQVTVTSPSGGELASLATACGARTARLAVGGLARGAGARAVAAWPRARALAARSDVILLGGGVPGRLLPALPGRPGPRRSAARVLHIHDMVDRVPRFWHRADLVLADSGAVAARLRALGGPPAEVVYGPVDPDPPAVPAPWPADGARGADGADGAKGVPRPVVGFVGRIEPRKGPLDLVRAAPQIRAALPGARIVLVGDDPYGSDPAYVRAVRSSPEVEHLPWTDAAPGLMRHLDVLVLPSRAEPFGTVLAEAMAVGTPVVATAVDGLPEVVRDGITGRLVPSGASARELAAAIAEVVARRAEMGAAARRDAERFHTARYVDRVEQLLGELLTRRER